LLVGAVTPANDAEYVYADAEKFSGEAAGVLQVVGISLAGKSPDVLHHELQRTGIFVAHVLECPIEENAAGGEVLAQWLSKRVPGTLTRIRRSLKPKRVALVGEGLASVLGSFSPEVLGCDVLLDGGTAFKWDGSAESIEILRAALSLSAAAIR